MPRRAKRRRAKNDAPLSFPNARLPFPDVESYRVLKVLYLPLIGAVLAGMITAYRWLLRPSPRR
jgi:hypothetical protein